VLIVVGHGNAHLMETWGLFKNGSVRADSLAKGLTNGKPQAVVLFGCDTAPMAKDLSTRLNSGFAAGVEGQFNPLRGLDEFSSIVTELLTRKRSEVDGEDFSVFEKAQDDLDKQRK
jgi:hypothetical protein